MMSIRLAGLLAAGLSAFAVATPPAAAAKSPEVDVIAHTKAFLAAYASGDEKAVLSQVAPDVSIYGSDVAETFKGTSGLHRMMEADHRLWRGPAQIGEMQSRSTVCASSLCVLTFQAPFTLAANPPVMVRFTMAWRRSSAGWRLVQSSNSTPTVGQSAEGLLSK